MPKWKRRAELTEKPARAVSLPTLFLAVVLAAMLAGGSVAAVDRLALDAPAGPAGPEGPPGPAGDAGELDSAQVWEEIEADPERLAGLLDPMPSELSERDDEIASKVDDVSSEVERVADDLDALCGSLSLAGALDDAVLSCP